MAGAPDRGHARAREGSVIREPHFKSRRRESREPVRILLLEDDPISVELVRAYLGCIPFAEAELQSAATVADALALLARGQVDLVISDLNLPDSEGAATIARMVQAATCPVIAITSDEDPGLRDAVLARGAYDFVQKGDLTEPTLQRLVRLAAMQARTFHTLRESEARFRGLTALLSDWFWETDAEHQFVAAPGRGRVTAVTGLAAVAYVGKPRWQVPGLSPVGADWSAHRAALARRETFRDLELEQVRPDGSRCYLQISGEPVYREDGKFKGYRGTAKDVTQHRSAEAALRESEERFRQTFELAGSGMAHLGLDGRFLRVNRSLCRILGYPEAELIGRSAKDISHPADRDVTDAARQHVRMGEADWIRAQKRYLRKDGATVWVELTVALARDAESNPIYEIAVIEDITERKNAESALRESEARFRTLSELNSDWYWEQDAELRFVGTSGTSDARGGITPEAHVGMRRWELPRTEIVGQPWDEHRRALAAREPFTDLLLRRTSTSGEVHYVSVAGRPIFNAQGSFTGYHGVAKDVTNRIESELALRRFRAALDAAGDMVFLVDARTSTYVDFNETACRTLGYRRDEMLGMDTQRVRMDRTREELAEDYRALVDAAPGASTTSVGTYRRKDGSTFPVEVTRRLLETRDGGVVVATARDLTERRRAEQSQAAHHRYQERIARFGQSALVKSEPSELMKKAVQSLLEALVAETVAYLEPESHTGELVLRAVVGVAGAAPGSVAGKPGEPIRQVLASGNRLLTEGAKLPLAWAAELKSVALVPVRSDDKVRGVLCVGYRQPNAFGTEEVNFIEATASVLSTALQRIDSEVRLAYLAQFDSLTGLPNRALFADRFSQMIVQAARRSLPLAVLFIDLDEFKLVNDTLGHAGGDALLKEVAVRLQSTVRGGDTVARISGDEFAIVLADLARPEDAALVAQKVIDRLSAAVDVHGKEVFVTASVGIAAFPADGADAEALIGAADAAMYRAKQSGRNAYQFFTAEINQRSRARAQMGSELRRALEREEFALAYQPKYHLATRRLSGAEALLRWKHPERGMVMPAEFIPVLEETGLIVPVGEWVVRRACADLKAWRDAGLGVGPVSVNLSARQFRQADLHERIKSAVVSAGVDAGLLELEITESQLMQDPDHAIHVMRALCDAGMRIAIDDFGTGYSRLAYLTRFPVGSLKIDRSFVKDMSSDKGDGTIVRTIIEMAHSLGFTVIAEGVETEEQANFLRLLRCEQAQGYLFARPMPAGEFSRFCASAPR